MTRVVYRRRYAVPYPVWDTPVRDSIDGGDAEANEDGSGAIVGSVGSERGGGRGFYSGEEDNNDRNGGSGYRSKGVGWGVWDGVSSPIYYSCHYQSSSF